MHCCRNSCVTRTNVVVVVVVVVAVAVVVVVKETNLQISLIQLMAIFKEGC